MITLMKLKNFVGNNVIQLTLLLSGICSSILLSYPSLVIYGFVVILITQPVWIYETYKTNQWGIMGLAILYIFTSLNGIYNFSGLNL